LNACPYRAMSVLHRRPLGLIYGGDNYSAAGGLLGRRPFRSTLHPHEAKSAPPCKAPPCRAGAPPAIDLIGRTVEALFGFRPASKSFPS
jgi:hypothetical protein